MTGKTYRALWGVRRWPSNSNKATVMDIVYITISIGIGVMNIIQGRVVVADLLAFRVDLHGVIAVVIEIKSIGVESHGLAL